MEWNYTDIATMIDHALLSPDLSETDLMHGLFLARDYKVASVCILPYAVSQAVEMLEGCHVKTSTTIGFPHGCQSTAVKATEAFQTLEDGAEELDMVVNISKVLSGDWTYVTADINAVLEPTQEAGEKLKVIFENAYLDDSQIKRLCHICGDLGVDWVKTSTGYASTGATEADVLLMRQHSPPDVQIKAAGGIRDLSALLAFRKLGVTRIGASATSAILEEARRQLQLPPLRGGNLHQEGSNY